MQHGPGLPRRVQLSDDGHTLRVSIRYRAPTEMLIMATFFLLLLGTVSTVFAVFRFFDGWLLILILGIWCFVAGVIGRFLAWQIGGREHWTIDREVFHVERHLGRISARKTTYMLRVVSRIRVEDEALIAYRGGRRTYNFWTIHGGPIVFDYDGPGAAHIGSGLRPRHAHALCETLRETGWIPAEKFVL